MNRITGDRLIAAIQKTGLKPTRSLTHGGDCACPIMICAIADGYEYGGGPRGELENAARLLGLKGGYLSKLISGIDGHLILLSTQFLIPSDQFEAAVQDAADIKVKLAEANITFLVRGR